MSFLGLALGGVSALMGASSANKAADAQKDASDDQLRLARQQYREQKKFLAPYRQAGQTAQSALNYEMGLGEMPTIGGSTPQIERYQIQGQAPGPAQPQPRDQSFYSRGGGDGAEAMQWGGTNRLAPQEPQYGFRVGGQEFRSREEAQAYADSQGGGGTPYRGFQETPGYQFMLDEGLDAVNSSFAGRNNLLSGAAMQSLQERGTGLANQEYGTYLNRLTGMANSGQNAASGTASASQNFTNVAGNAYGAAGNAASAGAIGVGNALQGGINTGLGIWQYQSQLANQNKLIDRLGSGGSSGILGTPGITAGLFGGGK